jgi:hypothetical protein
MKIPKISIPKIEHIGFIGAAIALMLAFFYLILGISGMTAALGIILLFILPFYLILNILDKSQLEQDEKIIFSFFIGVGVFPSITYWLGMLISFRVSIFITFAVLIIAGYLVWKFRKIRKKED